MPQNRPWQDKQKLICEYVENGKSVLTMADEWGCTISTISRWLDKHDIETRKRGVESPETTERLDRERNYRNESWLREMYCDKGMTISEIADEYDVSRNTLLKHMDRHNITRRKRSTKNRHPWVGKTDEGYMVARSWTENGGGKVIGIHRLVAVAHWGYETVKGNHVHHVNEVKWDNRKENLRVWSEKKHRSHHAKKMELHKYGAEAQRANGP